MLKACATQEKLLNKCQLEYITASKKCKRVQNNIDRLKTTFNIDEYQQLLMKNVNLQKKMQQT